MTAQSGIVNIRGKDYQTVALRVQKFREVHPIETGWRIVTSPHHIDDSVVVMVAQIISPEGHVVATGHAEELRAASQINSTSALENCETSAIGRALAAAGLGGTEYATANEVQNAIHQQQTPRDVANGVAAQVPGIKVGLPEIKWSPEFTEFFAEVQKSIADLPEDARAELGTENAIKKRLKFVVINEAKVFRSVKEMAECNDQDELKRAASAWFDHIDRLAAFT